MGLSNAKLYKEAGTLDVIKEWASGKEGSKSGKSKNSLGDNLTGLAATAGLGGLAGFLYDQSTKKSEASALRSLLLTGGGAALGAGAYGLTKALTGDKPLFHIDFDRGSDTPLVTETPLTTIPLALAGGYATKIGVKSLIDKWGPEGRALKELKDLEKVDMKDKSDPRRIRKRQFSKEYGRLAARTRFGSAYGTLLGLGNQTPSVFSAQGGIRGKLQTLRNNWQDYKALAGGAAARHGAVSRLRTVKNMIRGFIPDPASTAGLIAFAALSSPRLREKIVGLVDY